MIYSADETCDIGSDTASAVSDDYTPQASRFTGTIEWVQIDIDAAAEDLDHLISPDERLKIAMARQNEPALQGPRLRLGRAGADDAGERRDRCREPTLLGRLVDHAQLDIEALTSHYVLLVGMRTHRRPDTRSDP